MNYGRAQIVDLMGLIFRRPRTMRELAEVTGRRPQKIQPVLMLLRQEGLVRMIEGSPPIYRRAGESLYGELDGESQSGDN